MDSVFRRVPLLDKHGRPVLNDIRDPRTMIKRKFRFQWLHDHFKYGTDQFITRVQNLDVDDRASL